MTRLVGAQFADEAVSQEIDIADGIKNFVNDEFIGVAQPVFVEDSVIVEHDRIIHTAPEREISLAQCFDIAQETEGARAAHFLEERCRRKIDSGLLGNLVEYRMIELDLKVHFEPIERN